MILEGLILDCVGMEGDGQTAESMVSPGKRTRQFCVSEHCNLISTQGRNRAMGTHAGWYQTI